MLGTINARLDLLGPGGKFIRSLLLVHTLIYDSIEIIGTKIAIIPI